ncbi:MAG: Asp-tRNA(Asn)/Glu-tRNA(Gln) amidotransferase subunit GatB, partial [Acidimicrobiales bacterium]
ARRAELVALLGGEPTSAQHDQVRSVVASDLDRLVTAAAEGGAPPALALARTANEVAADPEGAARLDPTAFARLVSMEAAGELSATQSKEVLVTLLAEGGDPGEIARGLGFEAMDSGDLSAVIDAVVAGNADAWQKYVAGDQKVMGSLIGEVMKATSGKADGKAVAAALSQRRSDGG